MAHAAPGGPKNGMPTPFAARLTKVTTPSDFHILRSAPPRTAIWNRNVLMKISKIETERMLSRTAAPA
jgi:hypothetical protein